MIFALRLASVLVVAGLALMPGRPGHAEALRFGTFLPAPTANVRGAIRPWIEAINARAAAEPARYGDFRIDLYAGGAMGRNGRTQLKLLEAGVVDFAYLIPGYTPGRFPDTGLFEIPQRGSDALSVSLAFWRLYRDGRLRGFRGVTVLALFVSTPFYLHLDFPYRTAADLKGRKIRVATFLQARLMEAAGATPIGGIGATQLAESISRGLLDGTLFNWYAARPLGIVQVARYHVETPISYAPGLIVMNSARYHSLSPAQRRLIDQASGEALIRRINTAFTSAAGKTRIAAREGTVGAGRQRAVFIAGDNAEREFWRKAAGRQLVQWIGDNPERARLAADYRRILEQSAHE